MQSMNSSKRTGRRIKGRLGAIPAALAVGVAAAAEPEAAAPVPPEPWSLVTPAAAFSPRDSAKGCVFDGRMWLNNGYYHGNVNIREQCQQCESG